MLLEAFELAENQRAMGPGAGERDVQVIAAGLRREAAVARRPRCAIRSHPVANDGRIALEAAIAESQRGRLLVGSPAAINHRTHVPILPG